MDGDPSIHQHYMQGFKDKFGPTAGATMRYMGPLRSEIVTYGPDKHDMGWQDANLVQYDSLWRYAYIVSTDVYQELNQEKMAGLENTCMLLISEVEVKD